MGDKSTHRETWIRVGLIVSTAFIAFTIVWVNTYLRSMKYYKEGEQYFTEAKFLDAVTSYETSAHAYTPWNSYVKRSLDRMWEIGQKYETDNHDPDYALIAYRCLRSSIYAIRSIYTPYEEWIPKCDERIRALVEIQKAEIEEARRKQEEKPEQ
jgi:hypothetical protein